MKYSTFNTDDIMSWKPCAAWCREDITSGLGVGWSGTVIDVLNSLMASDGKIWVVLMSGDLSDAILEEFSESCKEHSPAPGRKYKETVADVWKASIGKEISVEQERAFAYSFCAVSFCMGNSDNRPLPLSEDDHARRKIERIAKKEAETNWQVSKLLTILSENE